MNAFELLEIAPTASKEEIKKAYKAMAKKCHPDLQRNPKLKKEAEERFKQIQSCYEYLMSINLSEDDFNLNNSASFTEFFDDAGDDADYDEFVKEKTDFNALLERAMKFVESELKKEGLSTLYAYQRISENKAIFDWDVNKYDTHTINDYLIKESLYRRHTKESEAYDRYIKNKKFYDHLNIDAVIVCGNKYKKKQFFEKVLVEYNTICKKCHGAGCDKCNQGLIRKQKEVTIKVPITDNKKFYEIKNGGHESEFGNGSLIITVVKKNKDFDFIFKEKSKAASAMNPFLDVCDMAWAKVLAFINLIKTHPHYSILYSVIICLIITIICLAVLL